MSELNGQLDRLETIGLIRIAQLAPELEYLFRHALVQDAAYSSMLKQDRRALHRVVAMAIEEAYPDRIEEFAPVLAMHFAQADDDARALHYYSLAGDIAVARYANAEAVQCYGAAITIAKRTPGSDLVHMVLQRGHAFEFLGDYPGALANYIDLQETAQSRGDQPAELAALIAQATIRATTTSVHNPQEADRLLNAALALARTLGDRASESKIEWNLMLFHKFSGRGEDAVRHGEASLAIARELNLREQMAYTMNDLIAHGYLDAGDLSRARQLISEVPALWKELGNQPMLADHLSSAAIVHYLSGDYDEVVRVSDEARHISDSIGNRWGQSYSRWIVGQVYSDRGEITTAIETMEESIALGESCGFLGAVVGVGSELALVLASVGRLDEAGYRIERALAASEESLPSWLAWPLASKARLYVTTGDLAAASQTVDRIERMAGAGGLTQFPSSLYSLSMAQAVLRLATDDVGAAHRALDVLEAYVERTQVKSYMADLHYQRGRVYLAQNETGRASASFDHAASAARLIGARRVLWQVLAAQAGIARREGRDADAAALTNESAGTLRWIADQIEGPDRRDTFLRLPDVQAVLTPNA